MKAAGNVVAPGPRVRARTGDVPALEGRGLRVIRHWWDRRRERVVGPALAGTLAAWGTSRIELHRLGGKAAPRPLPAARNMTHLALSADTLIAAGDGIAAWDTRRGNRLWRDDEIDEDGSYMLAISPDGALVITGGEDRTVRAFAARTGEELWQRDTSKMVWGGCFSRDGKRVAIGDWGGLLLIADAATGEVALEESCGMLPAAMAFTPSGKQLVIGAGHFDEHEPLQGGREPLSIFDLARKRARTIGGYSHGLAGVAMLGDERFATASYDGTVRIHALRGGELGRLDLGPAGTVPTALAVDGTTILVGTRDGLVLQLAATPSGPAPRPVARSGRAQTGRRPAR
jgi:putative pyrroloquinoline-quinone binding quinoprotein